MYRFILVILAALIVITLILLATGALDYSPLAIAASLVAFIVSVTGTTYLISRLIGVTAHLESSYITALILFFIFTPRATVPGVAALFLVGMIAAASKYLLAYRGRHIFNPAAVAAFIISFTGLTAASWWVATPSLAIPTLLGAGLILYKTRRLFIGLVFLSIAIPLTIIVTLSYGTSLVDAFPLLLSYPLLFFAGFMLSEPLTMAPQKWQQGIEAVIVGVLFAVPFSIGGFSTSLVLALLVGNAFAFAFRRQQAVRLTYASSSQLTPTTDEIVFTTPKNYKRSAGQYIEITLPHGSSDGRGIRRSFSVTSAPDDDEIRLGVKFYSPSSSFKKALRSLKKGDVLQATQISGEFTLPKDSSVPLLFIAGGIGITPFISHLLYLKSIGEKRDITLIYSASSAEEIAYLSQLETFDCKLVIIAKDAATLGVVSQTTAIENSRITEEIVKAHVDNLTERHVYISGPPPLIDGIKKSLKNLKAKRIKTDYFIGY